MESKIQLFQKAILQFLKKLNIELPYEPTFPLLDTYIQDTENICPNKNFYINICNNIMHWDKTPCPSIDEWINKI